MPEVPNQTGNFSQKLPFDFETIIDTAVATVTTVGFVAMVGAESIGKVLESKPAVFVKSEITNMYETFRPKGIRK